MDTAKTLRSKLNDLARNLWWCWQPEIVGLFRDLDPELWTRVNHNPIALLKTVDDDRLLQRARVHALESRILAAARRLDTYLHKQDTWGAIYAGMLKRHPVAYFSAEFGLHESLPLYSGGLGVLAGDHLKSASDLDVPIYGIGLLYAQGYFTQRLDREGWQQEEFGITPIPDLPLILSRDAQGQPHKIYVDNGGHRIWAQFWRLEVGRSHLILLDTDLPENTPDARQITHRLYWGDRKSRIEQEIVLGIGGLRALHLLGQRPGVYHMNEGHSAFALLEAIRHEMEENGVDFAEASHRIGARSVFTTHTPVPAGHDRFDPTAMEFHLGSMRKALGLSEHDFLALGRIDPQNSSEEFCMTVLALKLAHRANGVASVHGAVSREMWKELWVNHAPQEVPIGHITNGVHLGSWMAPQLSTILERRLGHEWLHRTSRQELWRQVEKLSPLEIWEHRQILKAALIDFVRRRYEEQETRRGIAPELVQQRASRLLRPDALTLGFARRFATYKRATLIFRDRARLARILNNPERPVQLIFAGKSHPRDAGGKGLIQEIVHLMHEPEFEGRVVFVEDYDMNVARHLVHGVDVWINNPKRPEEACGTSGMKAVLNGVLNCSIRDGWWAEGSDGRNGFDIASPGPHADPAVQESRDHEALLKVLEEEVTPLFYQRDGNGIPMEWLDRVRWAFQSLAWRYSADRMVMDYTQQAYLPAAMGDSSRMKS